MVEELVKNHHVVVIDDLSSGKLENIQHLMNHENFEFVEGSITDLNLLNEVFKDTDCVFHQAAIASVQKSIDNPLTVNEVNITGTLNVLIAARDCGVRKVVYASSAAVYGDLEPPLKEDMRPNPKSPYAVSKLAGEYYCRVFSEVYGLKTVSLRYFNIYGPRQDPNSEYAAVIPRFISRVLNDQPPIIYGDGEQTRDFAFVKDVVKANVLAMQNNVEIFSIAGGQSISINELAVKIIELAGRNFKPAYADQRPGDIKYSLADISLAKKMLGYEPEYSLDKGLRITMDWYSR